MKRFSAFHPVSLLLYFVCVLVIEMFVNNPVLYALSLTGSLCLYGFQEKRTFWRDVIYYLLVFILVALANPLFSHNGRTALFFLNGNPVTYEAILYGVSLAAMIVATLFWFKSFSLMMTSDKLLYLFGRTVPKLSVILSSALRFIPLFRLHSEKVRKTQTAMGLYSNRNYMDNAKGAARVFSVMVTWSLENAIDTSDSMKARGYGLHGRTQFSIFSFQVRDVLLIFMSALLFFVSIYEIASGAADFSYYPVLSPISLSPDSSILYIAYGLLVFLPFIYEVKENVRWTYCKSKI